MTTIKSNYLTIISDSMNQTFNVVYPVRPNPVRTQKTHNIDQRLQACTRVQTLTNGTEVKWVLTGCRGAEV